MSIITAKAKLVGNGVYQQGRHVDVDKKPRETHEDYENRTWRERSHYDEGDPDEKLFIPAMAFKKALESAARFNSRQIPGKGKQTYTKHFASGVLVYGNLPLAVKKAEVKGTKVFVPSDGKAGGGRRVNKIFPTIDSWEGEVEFFIVDSTITEDVFIDTLMDAGKFIGIGVYRPERSGIHGRFSVESVEWIDPDQD